MAVEVIFLSMVSVSKLVDSQSNLFLANQMHQTVTGKVTDQGILLAGWGCWWVTVVKF